MNKILLALCAFTLIGCGGSGGSGGSDDNESGIVPDPVVLDRETVLGSWIAEPVVDCFTQYNFGNQGGLRITSGVGTTNRERLEADYSFTASDTGRSTLEYTITSDNGGTNCDGAFVDDTSQIIGPIYIEFSGNSASVYSLPEDGDLLFELDAVQDSVTDELILIIESEGY